MIRYLGRNIQGAKEAWVEVWSIRVHQAKNVIYGLRVVVELEIFQLRLAFLSAERLLGVNK